VLTHQEQLYRLSEVREHQRALAKLAELKAGPFAFRVERTEMQLSFEEFFAWMEGCDLREFGAYNGNWAPPAERGEPWVLVLAAQTAS
jgi:hypothetical protein